ncbi:hypothetical protein Tco_1149323, partial [Tanacetum coccineum]
RKSSKTKVEKEETNARPHLERGSVEELIDTNLLLEPCNMDVMLKMGLLGLRCAVIEPKQRFHDTSSRRLVYQGVDTSDGAYDQLLYQGHQTSDCFLSCDEEAVIRK